nr:MAG TPA: hypothetical protein [Caudoviricetes sp.]DAW70872.1 MAG TPA: hypothetical protein [Caudoviricetes sp.]
MWISPAGWTRTNGSGSMPDTVCCGKLSWKKWRSPCRTPWPKY